MFRGWQTTDLGNVMDAEPIPQLWRTEQRQRQVSVRLDALLPPEGVVHARAEFDGTQKSIAARSRLNPFGCWSM